MTVQELLDELEGMNPEAEARLATQPSWPFEYSVSEVAEVEPGASREIVRGDFDGGGDGWYLLDHMAEETDGPFETEEAAEAFLIKQIEEQGGGPVVYIGEGTQLGYLPGEAREAIGW